MEKYQQTITRDDFVRLIQNVYCTHGLPADTITIEDKSARILMNRNSQNFFTLRFASDDSSLPVPRLWRPAISLPPRTPKRPLSGLRIALDPGHRVRADINPAASRNIVEHDAQAGGFRDCTKMAKQSFLARFVIVRRHDERAIDAHLLRVLRC